jgi:hypothetical protein
MKTNLKVIMTAISLATLASPVMAQSLINRAYVEQPAADISNARGSVAGLRVERNARTERAEPVIGRSHIQVDDAVHVAFPQQDNGN